MGLATAALYFLTAVCYTNDIYFCHPIYQYGFLQIAEESEWFMPEQGIVILGIVIVIILLLLAQLYLSTRKGRAWGLILPVIFLAVFIYVKLDIRLFPIDIVPNQVAVNYYLTVSLLGLTASAAIYIAGRALRRRYLKRKEQQRQMRLIAKEQRQIAAACGENSFDATRNWEKQKQRMDEYRRRQLSAGRQQGEVLAAKEQAKRESRTVRRQKLESASERIRQQRQKHYDARLKQAQKAVEARQAAAREQAETRDKH